MLVRAVENGVRKKYEVKYQPYLFLDSRDAEPTGYETIFGEPVRKRTFGSIREAKAFIKKHDLLEGFRYHGMTQFVFPFLNDKYPGKVQYDRDLINIVSLDIETMADDGFPNAAEAKQPLTAIAISDGTNITFISIKEYKKHQDNVTVIRCEDEVELIYRFIEEWRRMDPDIITGWNVEFFDVPYLVNRIRRICGDKVAERLSPWGFLFDKRQVNQMGMEGDAVDIVGIPVMDYLMVYRKWNLQKQESYKLDHIAKVELGLGKIDYEEEYGSLHGLYERNFQLYAEYNIRDTEIINQLDEKLKLMDLALALAYDSKINYDDAYTSVRTWDVITHNYLMERGKVVPQHKHDGPKEKITGGYVKDPNVGAYDWVCSFDLNSLYPHLIMQYNISPDTHVGIVRELNTRRDLDGQGTMSDAVNDAMDGVYDKYRDHLKHTNVTLSPNGCMWTRTRRGFLPELMDQMYRERSEYKRMMLDQMQLYEDTKDPKHLKLATQYDMIQMAKKIQLNSAYGALGNQYFRYFNRDYAEAITMGGRLSTRWIERRLNVFLNKKMKTSDPIDFVIACDTDSVYLELSTIVDHAFGDDKPSNEKIVQYLDKICSQVLEPVIDKSFDQLAVYVNAYEQKMVMKREAIASRAIWTGKKHYILNIYNDEGVQYTEPKLKMKGIEAVKSSTPQVCRDAFVKALNIIMNGDEDELIDYVTQFREEFEQMPFEMVAFPRSLNNLDQYKDEFTGWKKGTPIHVRGAIVFNMTIKEMGLEDKIAPLRSGEKIKFSYMRMPNPTYSNVITVDSTLPADFKLDQFIDHDMQFEKSFEGPLQSITNAVGWKTSRAVTLEDIFGAADG